MTVGIIGLGIIGGSMAKAIKANTHHKVLGLDINDETMTMALMSGAIDGRLTDERLSECQLVMAALTPEVLVKTMTEKAPYMKGTTFIDLCGIKRAIYEPLSALAVKYEFNYIGGHPMAGKEVSGFANSSADLFKGASMIVTPDSRSDIITLDKLKDFFLAIGFGVVTFSTLEEHDRIIAYTSQLAHITSNAYIKSPTAQMHMGFSAGSYRDLTRVARLDENMWTELFMANSDYLIEELRMLIDSLGEFLEVLETKDKEKLTQLLREGRELKETAGGN
ncbi:MAG: prephenate dehydrogenase [Clostridia bacterium]|nr:prephenate dehydrogenase [Clostridia bacterium]